jgi:hypothetical protein
MPADSASVPAVEESRIEVDGARLRVLSAGSGPVLLPAAHDRRNRQTSTPPHAAQPAEFLARADLGVAAR